MRTAQKLSLKVGISLTMQPITDFKYSEKLSCCVHFALHNLITWIVHYGFLTKINKTWFDENEYKAKRFFIFFLNLINKKLFDILLFRLTFRSKFLWKSISCDAQNRSKYKQSMKQAHSEMLPEKCCHIRSLRSFAAFSEYITIYVTAAQHFTSFHDIKGQISFRHNVPLLTFYGNNVHMRPRKRRNWIG